MTKRSNKTTKQSTSQKPIVGGVLATIIAIILFIIQAVTGVDVIGMLTGTPSAPTSTPTIAIGTPISISPTGVKQLAIPNGHGAEKNFWQVYFTEPSSSNDRSTYTAGIDTALTAAIDKVQTTLDIAAYEFNNPMLTDAVLRAKARGVRVRVVTDNDDGINDEDATLRQFVAVGIPVVDDGRSALMHNKFMILDSHTVWMGSWNYTVNDTYRNNNNAMAIRSQRLVQNYQTEFDEMFVHGQFGPRSPSNTPHPRFVQDGVPIQVYFAPEDNVVGAMREAIQGAKRSIRFMAFSFTIDEMAQDMLARAAAGVKVEGIFERTGSETAHSELTPLFCAGLPMRQDGNRFILHHKVIIIDDLTVITGSFNFSANATNSNDENLIIMQEPDLAAQFNLEFDRRWAESMIPANITCN